MCFPNISIKSKWISEFHRRNPQELKCWSTLCVNYFLRYYLVCSINLLWKELMECMSEHTGLISSYQLLITAACTNTGSKMRGSHSRAADRWPFVPRHSLVRLPLSCSWECYVLKIVSEVSVITTDKNKFGDSVFCDINSSRSSDNCKLSHHGSDYGLSLDWRQAIYWTNTGLLEPTVIFQSKYTIVHSVEWIWKYRIQNGVLSQPRRPKNDPIAYPAI